MGPVVIGLAVARLNWLGAGEGALDDAIEAVDEVLEGDDRTVRLYLTVATGVRGWEEAELDVAAGRVVNSGGPGTVVSAVGLLVVADVEVMGLIGIVDIDIDIAIESEGEFALVEGASLVDIA